MSELLVAVEDGQMTLAQMETLHHRILEFEGNTHWHYNKCGCCVTLHAPVGAYVIGRDGGADFHPGVTCGCEKED